ncbi:RAVE protein 1 C terminal-domain-containing protein [Pyronema omphalodes]|nr:RAVE protein 1 C terminal-domain-containing protein [Pyronema omphalodes]
MFFPGLPQPTLQALCTVDWDRNRIIAYISGNTAVLLAGVDKLLQTIYFDHQLSAIAIDEVTGKLAVCGAGNVWVYKPHFRGRGNVKWTLLTKITLDITSGNATTLAWGINDELIIGSNSICMYLVSEQETRKLWSRSLANPLKLIATCPDASMAATIAKHDRLVKIWWKISIGEGNDEADFSYLAHPRAVTWMQWRQPVHPEETIDNALYTITVDQVLRVWAPVHPHDSHQLQLWATIDLRESIPPALDGPRSDIHHALVVDRRIFTRATERAANTVDNDEESRETLNRLIDVAQRSPEIVIVFDSRGRMSAWGLENVGCKSRRTTNIFSIVHAENSGVYCGKGEVQFATFVGGEGLTVLMHSFGSGITWFETRLDSCLDPVPNGTRFHLKGVWTGHDDSIQSLVRTADGKSILSSSESNKHLLWVKSKISGKHTLHKKSTLTPSSIVERSVILNSGSYMMTLHADHIILWDTTAPIAQEVARSTFTDGGRMLCLLLLPEVVDSPPVYHVVAVNEEMTGIAWEITLPVKSVTGKSNGTVNGDQPSLREMSKFDLGHRDGLLALIPVDPVGWNAVLSENLDMFSREVATSMSKSGVLRSWTVKVNKEDSSLKWLATSSVETNIKNPSLARGNSIRKIALVDESRTDLSIWDSKAGQLEFQNKYTLDKDDLIKDLDWTSTSQSQSILAVGFRNRVILMTQLRYDYLNAGPAWGAFREIDIANITPHPIGDSIWLHDGGLVIGTGNQLLLYPRRFEGEDRLLTELNRISSSKHRLDDIFDIVSELNGPLPVYHPQFLQQSILAGKSQMVEEILLKLYKELRVFHEEMGLDPFLGLPIESYASRKDPSASSATIRRRASILYNHFEFTADHSVLDEELAIEFCKIINSIDIPHLTKPEQKDLAVIVESVGQVQKHRRSIDEYGAQYLVFFRLHNIHRATIPEMSWREITWAFHSDSQEILIDLVNRDSEQRMLWPQARESGIFMWLKDTEAIKRQFELLARSHYTSTDERNPVDCALYYLALKKKNVLAGLWRMAHWHKEQAATMRILANDFTEPRWRTAAAKNAYALMGKHRFEYAAAFFLLGDYLEDAVNVIHTRVKDPQLAIAICRVYESSPTSGSTGPAAGPVLQKYLTTKILPSALSTGDRWLASWCHWQLGRRDLAVRSLLDPLGNLCSATDGCSLTPTSKLFLRDDPALIQFYRHVREKTTSTLKGALEVTPGMEWEFVIATARVYDRMGCDLLALDLVSNWEFLMVEKEVKNEVRMALGRGRRNSLMVVDTVPDGKVDEGENRGEKWREGLVQPAAAVWEEPDLDWAF